MTNHFNYSARYTDVVSDIESELVKSRKFRIQLDVYSTRIHMITDNLANSEPVLPRYIARKYDTDGNDGDNEKVSLITE